MVQRKWNGYTKVAGALELFHRYTALTNWLCQSSGWAQTPLSPVFPALHLHSPAVHLPWIVWGVDLGPVCSGSRCQSVSSPQKAHAIWPLKFSEQILYCFECVQWFDSFLTNHFFRLDVPSIHDIVRFTNCMGPTAWIPFIYSTASAILNMSLVVFMFFFSSISINILWHVWRRGRTNSVIDAW